MDHLYCRFKLVDLSNNQRATSNPGTSICTMCGSTRFQAHNRNALTSFLRNFLLTLLFTENYEQQGSGKNRIVTKEI